ncbi:MAG: hypothetical protein KAW13_02135 [Dehalococcoidia bacterium]|nr:hypothetical protein [Dehalococcoidia bacterium]
MLFWLHIGWQIKESVVISSLVLAQYIITALSSGFNAGYFASYRTTVRRRRIGALTLALLSGAIFTESLYFTCFAFFETFEIFEIFKTFQGQEWASDLFFNPGYLLGVRLPVCLGSLLMSILILRHLVATRQ